MRMGDLRSVYQINTYLLLIGNVWNSEIGLERLTGLPGAKRAIRRTGERHPATLRRSEKPLPLRVFREGESVLIRATLPDFQRQSIQYSTPGCAATPDRNGCFSRVISVARSASSMISACAFRPVRTTCVIAGFSSFRNRVTSSTSR